MSDEIKVQRLNFNREKACIVNLILSTEYCSKVLPVINEDHFTSKYAGTLISWVSDYYNGYGVAPKLHINEMFEEMGHKLDEVTYEQVGNVLQHLSDVADTEIHNIQYLIDTADDLFRERHLALQNKMIEVYLEKGDLVSAEAAANEKYHGIKDAGDKFIHFDDQDFISDCVRDMVMQQDPETAFFRFSGRLGDFIGPIDAGWFVAFLAPAKRGKTTYMLDAAIDSVRQRKNTVVISLEMLEKPLMQRYALAVTGIRPEEDTYTVMTPIMDCKKNQSGDCEKDTRVGSNAIVTDDGLMSYEDVPTWTVCTECRGGKETHKDFVPAAWKIPIEKKTITEGDYVKKIHKFNKFFGKYGRIIHKSSKSVTVADLRASVQSLRDQENFIVDVIVLDYADLIKPDGGGGIKRHELDDIWEGLRAWGQEEHVLIISASQTNRTSADVLFLRDIHVAEDYSKIAKVDIAIGLCQNDEMKEQGIIHLNKVAHRHREYVQSHVCCVLQELSSQQSTLDSEFTVL